MIDWISAKKFVPGPVVEHGQRTMPWVLIYSKWHDPCFGIGTYDHNTEYGQWCGDVGNATDNVEYWARLEPPGGWDFVPAAIPLEAAKLNIEEEVT